MAGARLRAESPEMVRDLQPGSMASIGRAGSIPVGYYKDEAKTAETFKTINGVRYDAEVHLVHTRGDDILVMGILFSTKVKPTKEWFLKELDLQHLNNT